MTEDELVFAIATVQEELTQAQGQLKHFTCLVDNFTKVINNNTAVRYSLTETLVCFYTSPVVSLTEYRSIINGLKVVDNKLKIFGDDLLQARQMKEQSRALVSQSQSLLTKLEAKLQSYVPPKTILQFRRPGQTE